MKMILKKPICSAGTLSWKRFNILIAAVIISSCSTVKTSRIVSSGNPVFPGWYADPEAVIFNNSYWIFPTYSAKYEEQVFFDAFSSRDLKNWTKHQRIFDSSAIKWAHKAMWAPSVVENNGKYYNFFAANDIQKNEEPGGIGIAVSHRPGGPYKDHLGKPLIDKIINGAQPIDQYVFKDSGQWYMVYGGWRHCNIVKLNNDFTALEPFEDGIIYKEFTPEGYVEGPLIFRRNNTYYFMWSEGGWTGPNYSVAYATGPTALGPYTRQGTILQQDPAIARGAGHHSVLNKPGTDEWFIVYHRRPANETARDFRVTCIEQMYFDADGKILPVKITHEGVGAQPIR